MTGICWDITERKQAGEALVKALAKAEEGDNTLKALMEHVPDGITIADAPDLKIRHVSRCGQELLGGAHTDMTASAVAAQWKVFHTDGVTPLADADLPLARAMCKGETVRNVELVQISTKGQHLPLLCNAAPIRDQNGAIKGSIVVWRDMTERKRAEEARHASEAKYRSLFENNLDAIFTVNSEGRFLSVNPAAEELSGYSSEELQKRTFMDLCAPEYLENTIMTFTASLQAQQAGIETAMFRKDGRRVELFISGVPVQASGKVVGLFCIARDITRRKREELERSLTIELFDLINSEDNTRSLLRAVTAFFHYRSGCDAVEIKLCEEPPEHDCSSGHGPAEGCQSMAVIPLGRKNKRVGILQLNSLKKDFFTPEAISFWERLSEKLSIAISKFQAEEALKKAHNELEQRVQERTAQLQAAYTDLTESENRFRQMAESVREVFWLADGKLQVIYASPAFEEIWGYSRHELYTNPLAWLDSVHPEDRDRVEQVFLKINEKKRESAQCEYRIIRPDGSIRWIADQGSPVRGDDEHYCRCAGVARDVTSRKIVEIALRRANRALLMLQECDEALARASSESELLTKICELILEIEGVKMAWVGFAEHNRSKTVRVIAHAGDTYGYLKKANITWADEPHGRGPTGTAIRSQKVNVCRDISSDERLAPWRAQQLKRGYAASIALPLVSEGNCLGALTIYASFPDAFNEQEVDLLKRLASDLTYGIVALRARAEYGKLQQEILRISEREKQLISQELHDGLCQNLAGTALMSRMLHTRLAAENEPNAKYAKEIYELLNTSVDEARNLSHGLHPVGPEGEGLMNALSQLARTVRNLFHIDCTFRCPEPVIIENGKTSTHLFRITQEAINNARKHGEADQVMIGLHHSPEGVTLTIEDNGVGISVNTQKKSGMGLRIMNHRASEIGATLTVRRLDQSGGTVVTCTLPSSSE